GIDDDVVVGGRGAALAGLHEGPPRLLEGLGIPGVQASFRRERRSFLTDVRRHVHTGRDRPDVVEALYLIKLGRKARLVEWHASDPLLSGRPSHHRGQSARFVHGLFGIDPAVPEPRISPVYIGQIPGLVTGIPDDLTQLRRRYRRVHGDGERAHGRRARTREARPGGVLITAAAGRDVDLHARRQQLQLRADSAAVVQVGLARAADRDHVLMRADFVRADGEVSVGAGPEDRAPFAAAPLRGGKVEGIRHDLPDLPRSGVRPERAGDDVGSLRCGAGRVFQARVGRIGNRAGERALRADLVAQAGDHAQLRRESHAAAANAVARYRGDHAGAGGSVVAIPHAGGSWH